MLHFGVLRICWVAPILLASMSLAAGMEGDTEFNAVVAPFLKQYCYECHGADEQSGERRFDQLSGTIGDDATLVELQDVLDQLNLSEMPPQEASQPTAEQRLQVIRWLTRSIGEYHATRGSADEEVVLRRLNAREYRNTVRDLFRLDMAMFDPAQAFPRDETTEHLDNVGDTLVVSGYLLARYLDAAEQVVSKAMHPLTQPAPQVWRFSDGLRQQPEIDQVHRKTNKYAYLTLYDVVGADKHEGAYAPIHAFARGVPHDGFYEIRFRAAGLNREHPYEDDFLGMDRREPLRLGIVAGNHEVGPLHKPQPIEPLLAEMDLSDEMQTYSVRVWLDQGYTPRFTFRNGLMDSRTLWTRIQKKYPDLFPKAANGIVAQRYNAIANGSLPQIHVDDIEIEGPFYDQWPRPSQVAVLGEDWSRVAETGELSEEQVRSHLAKFMTRALRRKVADAEVERVASLVVSRQAAGVNALDAFGDGIKAVLCSPSFLYLEEGDTQELPAAALAARLSYFLWSSMPDAQLAEFARSGELLRQSVLQSELQRMLADPKAAAFVDGFLDTWLTLRDLGSSPPDRGSFREYYHYDLGAAMREETVLFTRHILEENLSIDLFIDSDFTFLNKRLATHYGIEVPESLVRDAGRFERVQLDDDLRGDLRGGLLGQASVLTVSANGIDTSPVVRGVWLLENILGVTPSPPPPDVAPLDPDVRGAKSIRDQLEKHRDVPSCYDCHRKIDPLGFALESFDPIGKWRDKYKNKAQVETAGKLPNGKSFKDVRELKVILLEQKEQFSQALIEKMLAYSLGRTLGIADRPHVDSILQELRERGDGFRDLVELVVMSDVFRRR